MKRQNLFLVLAILLCLPANFYAQEKKEVKYVPFFLIEDQVKPSMYFEYMKAAEANMQFFKDHQFKYPIHTFRDDEYNVYFSIPMGQNIAFVDSINAAFNTVYKADTAGWDKMFDMYDDTYSRNKTSIIYWSKALSYIPEMNEEQAGDNNYIEMMEIYAIPGKMDELKAVMKEWVAFYKKNNIEVGFDTYVGYIGTDLKIFLLSRFKDELDAATKNAKANEILEKTGELMPLYKKTLKSVEKINNKMMRYLPKYSYQPK